MASIIGNFNKEVRVGTCRRDEGNCHGVSYHYISAVQEVLIDEDEGLVSIVYKDRSITTLGKRDVVQVATYFTKSSGADVYVCSLDIN